MKMYAIGCGLMFKDVLIHTHTYRISKALASTPCRASNVSSSNNVISFICFMYYIISCCHWSRAFLPQQIKCFSASLTFQFVVFWRCPFFLLIQHPSEFIFLTFAHLSFQIYANVFLWQTILFIYHFLLNLKDCGVMDTVPRKNEGFFSFYVSLCSCVCVCKAVRRLWCNDSLIVELFFSSIFVPGTHSWNARHIVHRTDASKQRH